MPPPSLSERGYRCHGLQQHSHPDNCTGANQQAEGCMCYARQPMAADTLHHSPLQALADNALWCCMCAVVQTSSCSGAAVCWALEVYALLDEKAGKGLEVTAGHCLMMKACLLRGRAHVCAEATTPLSDAIQQIGKGSIACVSRSVTRLHNYKPARWYNEAPLTMGGRQDTSL